VRLGRPGSTHAVLWAGRATGAYVVLAFFGEWVDGLHPSPSRCWRPLAAVGVVVAAVAEVAAAPLAVGVDVYG